MSGLDSALDEVASQAKHAIERLGESGDADKELVSALTTLKEKMKEVCRADKRRLEGQREEMEVSPGQGE